MAKHPSSATAFVRPPLGIGETFLGSVVSDLLAIHRTRTAESLLRAVVSEARLAATVELPGGTFILSPDPSRVRRRRLTLGVAALLMLVVVWVVIGGSFQAPQITWTDRVLLFAGVALIVAMFWFVIRLPSLRADAMELRIGGSPVGPSQRMPRSDLALIFRCQMLRAARYGNFWDKGYVFTSSDGTICIWFWSFQFADDDVAEFAHRLRVPIRGDFTTKVNDRVDLAST